MTFHHLSYAVMLAFCIVCTLPLERWPGAGVLRQPRRVALAVAPAGLVFLAWDLVATRAGHWRFDPGQTLPPRILGLPLEEVAFFAIVPLAALLTHGAVGTVLARRRERP